MQSWSSHSYQHPNHHRLELRHYVYENRMGFNPNLSPSVRMCRRGRGTRKIRYSKSRYRNDSNTNWHQDYYHSSDYNSFDIINDSLQNNMVSDPPKVYNSYESTSTDAALSHKQSVRENESNISCNAVKNHSCDSNNYVKQVSNEIDIYDKLMSLEKEMKQLKGTESETSKMSIAELTQLQTKLFQALHRVTTKLNDKIESSITCIVCYEQEKRCLFQPCNHLVACKVCSDQLEKCPICQCLIEGKAVILTESSGLKIVNFFEKMLTAF